jgi:hypothetical protein
MVKSSVTAEIDHMWARVNVNPDLYRLKGRNLGRVPRPEPPKTSQTKDPAGQHSAVAKAKGSKAKGPEIERR